MSNLFRGILCIALLVGMATPAEAVICCLINKIVECPPVRKLRNECRAKKAAKKMKVKKPLCSRLKELIESEFNCDYDCDGDCACE
jgi:hypothetical protein